MPRPLNSNHMQYTQVLKLRTLTVQTDNQRLIVVITYHTYILSLLWYDPIHVL